MITTINDKHKCVIKAVENVHLSFFKFPVPISKVKKREVPAFKELWINDNKDTIPPTVWYIPKSSIPNFCSMIRDVNKAIIIVNIIRRYKNSVFFAMVLLEDIVIKYYCDICFLYNQIL
ncbi:hypothetical protein BACEGG_02340 [Bacteroides eggerthii DSM 20697]|nr:hypothetical protein BACEGG_02340 [Bacteroides eggerthii DSM 20697]